MSRRWILVACATLLPTIASADPDWSDAPALIAAATAKVDPALQACRKKPKGPLKMALTVSRDTKTGASRTYMPLPSYVGMLGLTAEDRCLMDTSVAISLPPLPAVVDLLAFVHTVDTTSTAPSFGTWGDLPKALAGIVDDDRRHALGVCGARTVRLVLDDRRGKTRIWLPAWQFHDPSGTGTTPAAQQPIKRCLTKAIASWTAPALPADLGEIHLAIRFK